MAIRELSSTEWKAYFDDFSRRRRRAKQVDYAEVRVFSDEDGAQQETSWLPLQGLTYDPKSDLLEVLLENMDHLVYHPTSLHVDEVDGVLTRFHVTRRDGTREIIELR